jgi:Cdc6-like AAA superfamily ATPase/tetratricopeptide (TPR) repeat protein
VAYTPGFVGRTAELQQLRSAFASAAAGQGRLVMIAGEPGIGKTALCEQLADDVVGEGGQCLVGHCYEEGSLSLAYLPFLEALHAYVKDRQVTDLRRELGTGARDVARLVPELCERLRLELRPAGDPADDRWHLLSGVSEFFRNIAASRPLVLILEDLHDADHGTLDLLLQLGRSLRTMRVLVLGTYRDMQVDRSHPLSGSLADLRRLARLQRITLRGLVTAEIEQLLREMQVPYAAGRLAAAIHRQTEGNPLFVQEVARYLVEQAGDDDVQSTLDRLPEGLRDVIGKRLSSLSTGTNRVLTAAAVIGREFRLDVLEQVVPGSDEERYLALEEAISSAVLEDCSTVSASPTYRFTHALFRQALYEELIAPRRNRLHQQVARALEVVYGYRTMDHAGELAEHYAFCSDPEELAKAVTYGELAAKRAANVYAYAEAARLLGRALEVQELLAPGDRARRCDLLLALGEAMLPIEQPGRVARTVAAEAFAAAIEIGDSRRAALAGVQALQALYRAVGMTDGFAMPEVRQWLEQTDPHAAAETAERVYLDCCWGLHMLMAGDISGGGARLHTALEEAATSGNRAAYRTAAAFGVTLLQGLRDRELVERLALELLEDGPPSLLLTLATIFMSRGDRDRAVAILHEGRSEGGGSDLAASLVSRAADVWRAYFEGELEQAAVLGEQVLRDAREAGAGVAASGATVHGLSARSLFYLGRRTGITFDGFGTSRGSLAVKAVALAFVGRCDEVAAIRARFENIEDDDDETSLIILGHLLEASIQCGDTATLAILVRRLSPLADRLQRFDLVSFGRLLGEASVLLGNLHDAHVYFRQALALCRRISLRPEMALIQLDLAELLMRQGGRDGAEALMHLEAAISELRDMRMVPSLERALSLRNQSG